MNRDACAEGNIFPAIETPEGRWRAVGLEFAYRRYGRCCHKTKIKAEANINCRLPELGLLVFVKQRTYYEAFVRVQIF